MSGIKVATMSLNDLSASAQNYLKVLWSLQEWSDDPVTASMVAERLQLKMSSVSDGLRKLADRGLVKHARYGSFQLTEDGAVLARLMVRKHRLIEAFLAQALDYTWDEVHEEADELEHAVSDLFIERIDKYLGFPRRDPHGDPIPTPSGHLPEADGQALANVEVGHTVRVIRINDVQPELLQFLANKNIGIDTAITVAEVETFNEMMNVTYTNGRDGTEGTATLGFRAATEIWVTEDDTPAV